MKSLDSITSTNVFKKCIRIGMVLLITTLFIGNAFGSETVQQTGSKQTTEISWFPSNQVLINIYHETLPKADVLTKAYQLSLQGATASEAIADIKKAIQMCDDYIKANPNDKEDIAQAYVIEAYGYFNIGEFKSNDDAELIHIANAYIRSHAQQSVCCVVHDTGY